MIETLTIFQWTILSLSALCIGMSKTGVQGMMLLIVPYMAMAFGAKESTGVILPMLCMADIIAVAYYKRIADWKAASKRGQSQACFGRHDMERGVWKGKQVDAEVVVLSHLRLARGLHHDDRQCRRPSDVRLSALDA